MADGEVRIDVTVDESDAKKGLEDVEDKMDDIRIEKRKNR